MSDFLVAFLAVVAVLGFGLLVALTAFWLWLRFTRKVVERCGRAALPDIPQILSVFRPKDWSVPTEQLLPLVRTSEASTQQQPPPRPPLPPAPATDSGAGAGPGGSSAPA